MVQSSLDLVWRRDHSPDITLKHVLQIVDRINNDLHIINHFGHGNYNWTLKLTGIPWERSRVELVHRVASSRREEPAVSTTFGAAP